MFAGLTNPPGYVTPHSKAKPHEAAPATDAAAHPDGHHGEHHHHKHHKHHKQHHDKPHHDKPHHDKPHHDKHHEKGEGHEGGAEGEEAEAADKCPIPKPEPLTSCREPTFKSTELEQSVYRQLSLLANNVRPGSLTWILFSPTLSGGRVELRDRVFVVIRTHAESFTCQCRSVCVSRSGMRALGQSSLCCGFSQEPRILPTMRRGQPCTSTRESPSPLPSPLAAV